MLTPFMLVYVVSPIPWYGCRLPTKSVYLTRTCMVQLTAYFAQVQKVYDAGGRNFLFINVPPIERSPLVY